MPYTKSIARSVQPMNLLRHWENTGNIHVPFAAIGGILYDRLPAAVRSRLPLRERVMADLSFPLLIITHP